MRKRNLLIALIGIFTLVVDAYGQGCSQCKLLSKQGAALDEASFGTNINWGILYLMVIPYLLLMLFFRKKIISFFKTKMQKNKK